ncbi:MAG: sugar ABC transporter permease [Chloroflexota bacterium]|nr:sugar ABC transporter permease [Chloroflexota bacterium]
MPTAGGGVLNGLPPGSSGGVAGRGAPVFGWYTQTLTDYVLVGGAIFIAMFLSHRVLRLLGVGREAATGYALILPWLIGLVVWTIGPFIASFYLSFTDYTILRSPEWIGADNYVEMFTGDPRFWEVLRFTLGYSIINVPLGLVGALMTATLLNQDVKGLGIWRTLFYLPAVLPAAATALLWRWMLASDGLINQMFSPVYSLVGVERPSWLTNPDMVLPAYILMGLWGVFGANTIILLAGLKNIPRDLYDAAKIDGAGRWSIYLNVTLPMLSSTLFYVLIIGIIASLQTFTQAFFIQHTARAGTFMGVYIYEEAFQRNNMGYASALGWIMLIIILCFTLLVFKSSSAWVYYEGERAK